MLLNEKAEYNLVWDLMVLKIYNDLHYKMRIFKERRVMITFLAVKMIITGCYSPLFFRRKVKEKKKMQCSKHCVTLKTHFCHF